MAISISATFFYTFSSSMVLLPTFAPALVCVSQSGLRTVCLRLGRNFPEPSSTSIPLLSGPFSPAYMCTCIHVYMYICIHAFGSLINSSPLGRRYSGHHGHYSHYGGHHGGHNNNIQRYGYTFKVSDTTSGCVTLTSPHLSIRAQ